MATITLNYDTRNTLARKTLDYILSLGVFKEQAKAHSKARIEAGLKDYREGNIFYVNQLKKTCLK
jgi:hypothetical protein